ncbi:hypothetical protein K491DRAFT_757664 [Lophiostoma macrostomum CBS 122681]|uniref:Reverse transcriptase domain-containing protein n=1 Tax=Lophiostoma macrostomum CBS 122681 TaxID=1314788 RepID=A0A6A6TBN2_9PLEO|nr:hypothetical protein K491DRAFT_757664 [Lophiostoma macrostomum CBS 122681]
MAFSDDTYVIVVSASLGKNKLLLQTNMEQFQEWAHRSGAFFNPDKTEVIHFCSSHQRGGLPMAHYIPGFRNENEVTKMKILGVFVEAGSAGEIKWDAHLKYLKKKRDRLIREFKRIVQANYGLDHGNAIQVYKEVVRPSLTHGCEAWAEMSVHCMDNDADDAEEGCEASSDADFVPTRGRKRAANEESHWKILKTGAEILQNDFLRQITSALRWTHKEYMQIDTGIEALALHMRERVIANRAIMMHGESTLTIQRARQRIDDLADSLAMNLRHKKATIPLSEEKARDLREKAEGYVGSRPKPSALPKEFELEEDRVAQERDIVFALKTARFENERKEFEAKLFLIRHLLDSKYETYQDARCLDDLHTQHIKDAVKKFARQETDRLQRKFTNAFRAKKKAEYVDKGMPIPTILTTRWSRKPPDVYDGLTRVLCTILFHLRTEIGGFRHHLHEKNIKGITNGICDLCYHSCTCHACLENRKGHAQTGLHLVWDCGEFSRDRKRKRVRGEGVPRPKKLKKYEVLSRENVLKFPESAREAAEFVFTRIPLSQFNWTRENLQKENLQQQGSSRQQQDSQRE